MKPLEKVVTGLRAEAATAGFSLVGVAEASPSRHMRLYRRWLTEGAHGEMGYLARPDAVARRADLSGTMAEVRSVVVVTHEYFRVDPPGIPSDPSRAVVARYARGDDYHDVVKKKLLGLLRWLDGQVAGGVRGRAYVDTGPILERELAQRAGLGWFGLNTMLINPRRGSYFFLGVLLTDLALPSDRPFEEDRCGTCRACLDACPTGALRGRDAAGAPVIDARLCISYLTIELRGAIPPELRPAIGNRVFGCDICQEVCPWNERFATPAEEPAYRERDLLNGPELIRLAGELSSTDDEGFRTLFRRSAVRRAGRHGLLRNVCVALGNWGSEEAVPVLRRVLQDREPLIRSHAAWALGRCKTVGAVEALESAAQTERVDGVRREIEGALAHARQSASRSPRS